MFFPSRASVVRRWLSPRTLFRIHPSYPEPGSVAFKISNTIVVVVSRESYLLSYLLSYIPILRISDIHFYRGRENSNAQSIKRARFAVYVTRFTFGRNLPKGIRSRKNFRGNHEGIESIRCRSIPSTRNRRKSRKSHSA